MESRPRIGHDAEGHGSSMGPYMISHFKFTPSFTGFSLTTMSPKSHGEWSGSEFRKCKKCLRGDCAAGISCKLTRTYKMGIALHSRIVFDVTTWERKVDTRRGVRGRCCQPGLLASHQNTSRRT